MSYGHFYQYKRMHKAVRSTSSLCRRICGPVALGDGPRVVYVCPGLHTSRVLSSHAHSLHGVRLPVWGGHGHYVIVCLALSAWIDGWLLVVLLVERHVIRASYMCARRSPMIL